MNKICTVCKEIRKEEEIAKGRSFCRVCCRKIAKEYLHRIGKHKTYKGEPRNDLSGKRFGMLLVTEYTTMKGKDRIWKCLCDCGCVKDIKQNHLLMGNTNSCGCIRKRKGKESKSWRGYEEISLNYWSRITTRSRSKYKYRIIPFTITIQEAWELFLKQERKCALTGIELVFSSKTQTFEQTASLDRIDSSGGYTLDNVQWVHKKINFMKSDMTTEEFVNMCKLVVNNNKREKVNENIICS